MVVSRQTAHAWERKEAQDLCLTKIAHEPPNAITKLVVDHFTTVSHRYPSLPPPIPQVIHTH